MTDRPTDSPGDHRTASEVADALLKRALSRAWWTIVWERLWPPLASISTAVGLFLALSWAGVWLGLPPVGRAIGLFLIGVVTAICAVPLLRFRLPSTLDGLRRLDIGSGLAHRPATAIADRMATAEADQVSVALWRAHLERALRAARALRAGLPAPRLGLRDPMAVRGLVLVVAIAAFFGAGGERGKRIAAAFDWAGVVSTPNFRVDAWVTPPPYTAKPPVILPGIRAGEQIQASTPVAVPVGSILVIRASGSLVSAMVGARSGIAVKVHTTSRSTTPRNVTVPRSRIRKRCSSVPVGGAEAAPGASPRPPLATTSSPVAPEARITRMLPTGTATGVDAWICSPARMPGRMTGGLAV